MIASHPIIKKSLNEPISPAMLKRKMSYRCLCDVAPANPQQNDLRQPSMKPVALMIAGGPSLHSLPSKTKRARRNRTRISFLPRVKEKLDSCLDTCHEKALTVMRQLYFVEQAILNGEVIELTCAHTHLCGVLANDAEMIIVDMLQLIYS